MTASRIEELKKRALTHQERVQQYKGKQQTLLEQKAQYEEQLKGMGLTFEDLPAKIQELEEQIEAKASELEAQLAKVEG